MPTETPTPVPTPPRPTPPKPTPPLKPAPKPTPTERPKQSDDVRQQAAKREEARKAREEARKSSQAKANEAKSGESRAGATKASGADLAAYGLTILGEIQRHMSGVTTNGSVGVTFTVGVNGRIVSHSITESSGDASLDARVVAAMQAVQAPPPPGGAFTRHLKIRVHPAE